MLLAAHWIVVSLNESPGQGGQRIIRVWLLAAFAPVHQAVTSVTSTASDYWSNYAVLRGAKEENALLREKNAQLETALIQARDAQQKLAALEAELKLKQTLSYQTVQARVIGRDANQWFNTIIIDHGSFSGIREGQPVLTHEGLVGRVIQSAPNAARVLLLTDERSGMGAVIGQLADSRLLGVVKGQNDQLCEMKIISGEGKITNGEVALTSGQDGIYPPGLIIGRVSHMADDGSLLPSELSIAPAAPLDKLETVSVLMITREQIQAAVSELNRNNKEQTAAAGGQKK